MSEDIRWRVGTSSHPKIVRLVGLAGERSFRALAGLWEWCAAHRPDGNLRGLDDLDVAIAAGWPEAPPTFVPALVSVGLLDGKPGRLRVHDWKDEQAWVVGGPARSAVARNAAKVRWDKRLRAQEADARRMLGASESIPPSPIPNPNPSPTPPGKPADVPRGTPSGSNPPGLAAVPDSKGALAAKTAAEREREAKALDAFETELARWEAAGNRGGVKAFRELRTACLFHGAPFDPDRLYPVPWTPASLRGASAHA